MTPLDHRGQLGRDEARPPPCAPGAWSSFQACQEVWSPTPRQAVLAHQRRQRGALHQGEHRDANQHAYWPPNVAEVVQAQKHPYRMYAHLAILLHELHLEDVAEGEFKQQLPYYGHGQNQYWRRQAPVEQDDRNGHQHGEDGADFWDVIEEEGDHTKEESKVVAQHQEKQRHARAVQEGNQGLLPNVAPHQSAGAPTHRKGSGQPEEHIQDDDN
mmetsp:Transcript_25935/g.65412  ORF Transcript_25935/g.65412 Transcript_25935/m.65412 type:complete len:214 (-) Transcript_25935:188-829(-)